MVRHLDYGAGEQVDNATALFGGSDYIGWAGSSLAVDDLNGDGLAGIVIGAPMPMADKAIWER